MKTTSAQPRAAPADPREVGRDAVELAQATVPPLEVLEHMALQFDRELADRIRAAVAALGSVASAARLHLED